MHMQMRYKKVSVKKGLLNLEGGEAEPAESGPNQFNNTVLCFNGGRNAKTKMSQFAQDSLRSITHLQGLITFIPRATVMPKICIPKTSP